LGFSAEIGLREGIEDLYRWFREADRPGANASLQAVSAGIGGKC
jgi:hypothetical protein